MPLTIIFGLSASGKTTLADYLEKFHDYKKVVTYTTRPRRKGESKKSYHFISHKEFADLAESGFFAEYQGFSPNGVIQWYGTSKESISDKNTNLVLILDPRGIKKILSQDYNPTLVYLNEEQITCILRLSERGDDITEVARRMTYDLPIFKDFEVYLKKIGIPYLEFKDKWPKEMAERIVEYGREKT